MQLYIVRHGIAIDREDPKSPSDPERFLTAEGLRKTRDVARGFASLKISPDVFLSSPYVRAMQTAEIFAEALKFPKSKIKHTELLLPGAEPAGFFRELQRTSRSEESVVCFGHAPQMKKAGTACLELTRISPPAGQLVWLSTPKILRKRGKQD
jgi:phosphohistidine phosphatase